MDPVTILTAFIPVIQKGLSAIINKKLGDRDGAKPATIEETVKLGELEIRKLEALASIDSVSGTSKWVSDVRGIQRPVAVALILLTYVTCVLNPNTVQATMDLAANLASSAMFYLFGDRTLMYISTRKGVQK
jgi:hypothetical protein